MTSRIDPFESEKSPENTATLSEVEALSKAIILATEAHNGQVDLGGMPYILHPLSVMQNVSTLEEKTVAVLHDIVEDTYVTFGTLILMGFPDNVVKAVEALTHQRSEDYASDYILRIVAAGPTAMKVKLADLKDNMREDRPAKGHASRMSRYLAAQAVLLEALEKANKS